MTAKSYRACLLILFLALPTFLGCAGVLSQLGYWSGAGMIPPEYDGLEGQRVAVVCVSDNSSYGDGREAEVLSRSVSSILNERVKEIEVVRYDEIADWVDKNDWDQIDYREIGKGVKAQKVIAIDVSGMRLYEGQSLYRGRASVTVTVFDMTAGGKEVFRRPLPEVKFPTNGVYHSSETTESVFKRTFLQMISQQVARYFYEYEMKDTYSRDPALLGA